MIILEILAAATRYTFRKDTGMKKGSVVRTACVIAAFLFLCLAGVLLHRQFGMQTADKVDQVMDTLLRISLTGRQADETAENLQAALHTLEKEQLSRYMASSSVSQINQNQGAVAITDAMHTWLTQAQQLQEETGGAFDCTMGLIKDLWEAPPDDTLPDAAQVQALWSARRQLLLQTGTAEVTQKGCLDLGAVGKGIACDTAKAFLDGTKTTRAIVAVGGSLLLYGEAETFTVGVRDPFDADAEPAVTLTCASGFVSTSGGYERFREYDGVRYSHIIDGTTGQPVQGDLASVSVLCESGFYSDALSTACFVLGYEKSLALLQRYAADALFIYNNRTIQTAAYSGKSLTITQVAQGYKEVA